MENNDPLSELLKSVSQQPHALISTNERWEMASKGMSLHDVFTAHEEAWRQELMTRCLIENFLHKMGTYMYGISTRCLEWYGGYPWHTNGITVHYCYNSEGSEDRDWWYHDCVDPSLGPEKSVATDGTYTSVLTGGGGLLMFENSFNYKPSWVK